MNEFPSDLVHTHYRTFSNEGIRRIHQGLKLILSLNLPTSQPCSLAASSLAGNATHLVQRLSSYFRYPVADEIGLDRLM